MFPGLYLLYPQAEVGVSAQIGALGLGAGDRTLELLEQPVAILQLSWQSLAGGPAGEDSQCNLPTGRHMDALQVLPERQEIDILFLVAIAVGIVELTGVLYQEG